MHVGSFEKGTAQHSVDSLGALGLKEVATKKIILNIFRSVFSSNT